jgi:hypothetical protein
MLQNSKIALFEIDVSNQSPRLRRRATKVDATSSKMLSDHFAVDCKSNQYLHRNFRCSGSHTINCEVVLGALQLF